MKIQVLMDNVALSPEFSCEPGLSLLIESGGRKILFDTGITNAFADNAEIMGADLSAVDFAVISHGHYDHIGGLGRFLELNAGAPVYLSRNAFRSFVTDGKPRPSPDPALKENARIRLTGDYLDLGGGMELFSCAGRTPVLPVDSFKMQYVSDSGPVPDDFAHEQYLLINEAGRRIVISGCSHKGAVNICSWLKPDLFVGGFHFMEYDMDEKGKAVLSGMASRLLRLCPHFYTGHCTGVPQYEFLKTRMGEALDYLAAGRETEI